MTKNVKYSGRQTLQLMAYALLLWSALALLLIFRYQVVLTTLEPNGQSTMSTDSIDGENVESLKVTNENLNHEPPSPDKKPQYRGNHYLSVLRGLHELAIRDPRLLLEELTSVDPFNILGGPMNFTCPLILEERLDYPDIVDHSRAKRFVSGDKDSWIFYQHLRKAGGTGFCDLAQINMKRSEIPSYYCMPDNRGSLATPPWDKVEYVLEKMHQRGYRVAANEWDVFYTSHLLWPGAVFVTTFRHPVERYYSQYRFEHLEHRDGTTDTSRLLDMKTWYLNQRGWTMGSNYYIKTFIGTPDVAGLPGNRDFYWTYHKYHRIPITWDMLLSAVTNLRQFHLILQTEWLKEGATHNITEQVLGWKIPPRKVLPHEVQARRKGKTSTAKEGLSADIYTFLIEDNALDVLLYHVAMRISLERMCTLGVI